MKETAWGIIGCGDVTEKKSGPGAFNQPGSSLVAVMRRDGDKAADYARRHGVATSYADADELIRDASVNCVYIATPPGAHLELALRVATAGKPCIVEKPMARNLAESTAMAEAFSVAGVPLFVAYYRRCYPRYARLKKVLDEQTIGALSCVSYRKTAPAKPGGHGWRTDVAASGGGLFVDVGSHALDLIDFLVGPLREVRGCARGAPGAAETRVAASFAFDCGAVGVATWDFAAAAAAHEDTLELHGSGGTIVVPQLKNGDTIVLRRTGSAEERFVDPPPATVQQPFVASVIDAISSGESARCPSTAASALRTAAAMDAILATYYRGRDDAFWERPDSWATQ